MWDLLFLAPLPFFVLFVRGKDRVSTDITERTNDNDAGIRCPSCRWRPTRTDTWACNPGCNYTWNTFETRGECPSCGKRWSSTQCIKCGSWHLHNDWYDNK